MTPSEKSASPRFVAQRMCIWCGHVEQYPIREHWTRGTIPNARETYWRCEACTAALEEAISG